ncbi:ABC transporter substrate-binding protein [Methanocaldococcus indicus]|uniref:ABC transporter substrate-binding protein n=1 Tax=Methanocaldococcus indicus TaxID=213231 RepID=UPI003C6D289C
MRKYVIFMSLIILTGIVISGCVNNEKKEENVLTVYAAYGGMDKIAKAFEKDTGIKIKYISMSSGEVLARLEAERNNPSCDVWFGGGIDAFIKAKEEGLLMQYNSPNTKYIDKRFVDKDHYWTGVSIVTVGLLVNEKRLKEKGLPEPKTWDDLIKPIYKGEIIASNPTTSGTAYFTVCGILQMKGEKDGWAYLDKLYENTPFLTKRGSTPGRLVMSGEFAIGICPDPHIAVMKNKDLPIKAIYLDKVIWWPSPVAIVKNCKHPEAAKKFVDWVLSKRGQEVLMEADPRVPVRSDIKPVEGVPNPKELDFINMDFIYWSKKRDEILKEWEERYQNIITK